MGYQHTGCSKTTFWLAEGGAGLVGCMVMVLGFQLSAVGSLAGADLKKLKLNMFVLVVCICMGMNMLYGCTLEVACIQSEGIQR